MGQLLILGVPVRQDSEGRYSLNDLHQAAGGESRHQPAQFVRLDSTDALVREIGVDMGNPITAVRGGNNQGTYVCKELVYAYANWISPAFYLKVIRTFDAVVTGDLSMLPDSVMDAMAARFLPAIADYLLPRIGGVNKSVLNKAIGEALDARAESLALGYIADKNACLRFGKTAGQLWKFYGFAPLKNGPQFLSRMLVDAGCQMGGFQRSEVGGKTAKLFDPDKAHEFMKGRLRGIDACNRYIQQRNGQATLHLTQKPGFSLVAQ